MAAKHKNNYKKSSVSLRLRTVLPLIVLLVALYVIVPRLSSFNTSWDVLRTADPGLAGLALAAIAGTNIAGALVYWRLVSRPIAYWPMVIVQLASSFTNRLLPAGAGAMATSAAYLVKCGHTGAQAGSVVLLNNVVGFIGNILLLGLVVLFSPTPLGARLPTTLPSWVWLAMIGMAAAVVITLLWWPRARRVVRESVYEARRVLREPGHVFGALLASMAITACFAAALYLSAHAVAVPLSVIQAFYVMTVGVAAGAITPVPGGLGGVEAGLVAALLSVGVPAAPALAVALLYRLVSYWLPIIPGIICFQFALHKRYL
jgi:uncharacterized membrane protein YbhN (UPF0104 family)